MACLLQQQQQRVATLYLPPSAPCTPLRPSHLFISQALGDNQIGLPGLPPANGHNLWHSHVSQNRKRERPGERKGERERERGEQAAAAYQRHQIEIFMEKVVVVVVVVLLIVTVCLGQTISLNLKSCHTCHTCNSLASVIARGAINTQRQRMNYNKSKVSIKLRRLLQASS